MDVDQPYLRCTNRVNPVCAVIASVLTLYALVSGVPLPRVAQEEGDDRIADSSSEMVQCINKVNVEVSRGDTGACPMAPFVFSTHMGIARVHVHMFMFVASGAAPIRTSQEHLHGVSTVLRTPPMHGQSICTSIIQVSNILYTCKYGVTCYHRSCAYMQHSNIYIDAIMYKPTLGKMHPT